MGSARGAPSNIPVRDPGPNIPLVFGAIGGMLSGLNIKGMKKAGAPPVMILLLCAAAHLGAMTVDLEATLDPLKGEIRGRETVVWTNTTDAPAAFIPFHLYMNAFSGPDTVFMKESGGRHRMFGVDLTDSESFGGIDVTKITVNGKDRTGAFHPLTKLKDPARFGLYWPDEVTTFKGPDDSVGVLEMDTPVPPGGTVEIRVTFITRMPKIFARTGHYKTFTMAGQWFPKIAVFQGAKGWNCHLFHADSEFFSDFADYTLMVDVPEAYTVGATGARTGVDPLGQEAARRVTGRHPAAG